jgi:hypothetical protein
MSSGNTFYHNNFTDNYRDTYWTDSSVNNWDNGYPDGGNYWDRYVDRIFNPTDTHSGPNQDQPGADGFWDAPYPVSAESLDHYPIVPEYPSVLTLLFLMSATIIGVTVYTWIRRKQANLSFS